jgi:hypothetical protein
MIYFRWRWITLGGVVSEIGLALGFIILGELVSEAMGVFMTVKGEMTPVYASPVFS